MEAHASRAREAVNGLHILEANLERWEPDHTFDLVTCVHGLWVD